MNYSIDTILSNFISLVKFRPDFDTDYLDDTLMGDSTSGLYFNLGVHGLVTLKNILAMAPRVSGWNVAEYADTATYQKMQVVSYDSVYYYSLINDNSDNQPDLSPDSWKASTLQSIWLRREVEGVIEQVLADTVKAEPLIDHELLYRICDTTYTVDNNSMFVGFEIRPRNSEHLKVIINRIGTQFTGVNSDLTLYLYNQNTKVDEFSVETLENGFSWNGLQSDDENELYGSGKRWFLFYNQDDVTGQAIDHDFISHNKVSKFVDILPFEVPNTTTNFLKDVDGYTAHSYGLGLDLSVGCDLTQFLISNKQSFAKAIQYQFAYRMLDLFAFNSEARENLQKLNISLHQELLVSELRSENNNSVVSILTNEKRRVRKSLKFGDVCLPCTDENTIIEISNFG